MNSLAKAMAHDLAGLARLVEKPLHSDVAQDRCSSCRHKTRSEGAFPMGGLVTKVGLDLTSLVGLDQSVM